MCCASVSFGYLVDDGYIFEADRVEIDNDVAEPKGAQAYIDGDVQKMLVGPVSLWFRRLSHAVSVLSVDLITQCRNTNIINRLQLIDSWAYFPITSHISMMWCQTYWSNPPLSLGLTNIGLLIFKSVIHLNSITLNSILLITYYFAILKIILIINIYIIKNNQSLILPFSYFFEIP